MPSLAANFIKYIILPLRGTKAKMANVKKFSKSYTNSPKPCLPPKKLKRSFDINKNIIKNDLEYFLVERKNKSSKFIILYLHGGAYVNNLVKPHWKIINDLMANIDGNTIVPLYGLAPHYTQEDVFKQLFELYLNIKVKYPQKEILIAGDSAGGGLALAFTQMLRDEKQKLPRGLILFSPWLDVTMTDPSLLKLQHKDKMLAIPGVKWAGVKWAGKVELTNPKVSPLFGSFKDLPPIALFIGSADLLYSDAQRLKEKTIRENLNITIYEYPELFHVWVGAPIPEANQAMLQVKKFVDAL